MISDLLFHHPKILAECAIAERLRRIPGITLHPSLYNTPLIYGPKGARETMSALYREYLDTARQADLPLLLTAPTWRLDCERIKSARVPETINADAVSYLLSFRDPDPSSPPLLIGALTGPQNDCYRPDLAPDTDTAERFHSKQINELAGTSADFLLAQTLPSLAEALGIARAMAAINKPYIISFCTGLDGKLLDGTPLPEAMDFIDQQVVRAPEGYFVNCTHPRFISENHSVGSLTRLIGIQANASSKDVTQLDASTETETDPINDWASAMLDLHTAHKVPILGGCCGTSLPHMKRLITQTTSS